MFVNGGNLFFKRESIPPKLKPKSLLLCDLLVEGYNRIGCDALNVGAYDLSLGVDFLLDLEYKLRFPLISANLYDRHGRRYFRPYVLTEVAGVKVGIFGLIRPKLKFSRIPQGYKLAVRSPGQEAVAVVKELRGKGAEFVILATDLNERSSRRVARSAPGIDLIVGTSRRNQISLPFLLNGAFVTHLDRGGKTIGHLEVSRAPGEDGSWKLHNRFVPLKVSIPDDPVVGPLVKATLAEISKLQKADVDGAGPGDDSACGKAYLGAEACGRCHPDRLKHWRETAHSRAYETLVKDERQFDEDCVVCHALVFECNNGKLDPENLRKFSGVQCESCHGPGSTHAETEGQAAMDTGRVCTRCHTPERSEIDDFLSRIQQICPVPEGARP